MNTPNLAPWLEILAQPDHPQYPAALEQLKAFNPANLPREAAPALLAAIEAVMAQLSTQQQGTARELQQLRGTLNAAQAYGGRK